MAAKEKKKISISFNTKVDLKFLSFATNLFSFLFSLFGFGKDKMHGKG